MDDKILHISPPRTGASIRIVSQRIGACSHHQKPHRPVRRPYLLLDPSSQSSSSGLFVYRRHRLGSDENGCISNAKLTVSNRSRAALRHYDTPPRRPSMPRPHRSEERDPFECCTSCCVARHVNVASNVLKIVKRDVCGLPCHDMFKGLHGFL